MTILARTGLSAFRRNWFVVEALPLVGLIGGVLGFATFCGLRALKAPDVTINKTSNPCFLVLGQIPFPTNENRGNSPFLCCCSYPAAEVIF